MRTISATDLARSTREVLDSVFGRRETVVVERNRVPIARIVPSEQTVTAAPALAGLRPLLAPQQADAWLQDIRTGFDEMLRDPWA